MPSIKTTIEIEVEISAEITKATPNYFDKNQEQWYPGDPAEITDFEVWWRDQEITYRLSPELRESLLEQLIEEGGE